MTGRSSWLAVLALLASLAMGPNCNPGNGGAASLIVGPAAIEVSEGQVFQIDLLANVNGADLQAFDLDVAFDPATLSLVSALPGADFDDDGALFGSPVYDAQAGVVSGVVDLRHGTNPASGLVVVASLLLRAEAPGTTTVSLPSAALADATGTLLATQTGTSQVTVTP